MKIKTYALEILKIFGLLALQRVSILHNHLYRMWTPHPCLEESGLPLILILIIIIAGISVFYKHKINRKVMLIFALLTVAINAIAILFTDSFTWLLGSEGWRMYFTFAFVNLMTILFALLLLSQNHKPADKNEANSTAFYEIIFLVLAISIYILSVGFCKIG